MLIRSMWPTFYGPVILARIFKSNLTVFDQTWFIGTEWYRHSWHILIQSRWPTFNVPMILRYISNATFTVQWFWILSSRPFDLFWSNMVQWYKIMRAIMVYNKLVTVTYSLWFSDFGSYLQGYLTVFDQTWFIGTEWYTHSWPMLLWSQWLIFMVQWFYFISSMLFLQFCDFGL